MVDAPAMEHVDGGKPLAPAAITLPMFGRDYPLAHGAAVLVICDAERRCATLAIGHPDFHAGLFMGLSPDGARNVARWLLESADELDRASTGE